MRKAVMLVLLTVMSTSAMAEWILVSGSEVDDITAYADPATTIHSPDNRAIMWTLVDYKTAQKANGKTFMSVKSQNEYDCKEERSRISYANVYLKNMAGGEIVSTSIKPHEWEQNEPGSVGEALWKIACKR